jgi:hypothetical protein
MQTVTSPFTSHGDPSSNVLIVALDELDFLLLSSALVQYDMYGRDELSNRLAISKEARERLRLELRDASRERAKLWGSSL